MASASLQLDPSLKLFASSAPVEVYQVKGKERTKLQDGQPLEVYSATPNRHYPLVSALLRAGELSWRLERATHTMRSTSDAGEPTFIFSSVVEGDPDAFYCVILKRGHPAHELEVLQQMLDKLSVLHVSASVKKNAVPFNLPQVDPNIINEILRKGAEDTQMLINKAGAAASSAFLAAAEMHKQYAPKPSAQPVAVNPDVKDRIVKTKQAAAAGAAVAKGVATGMQAATVEVGTSLVQTVTGGAGKGKDGRPGSDQGGKGGAVPEPLKLVGGIGMELLRDVAAVRDAMLAAAGNAWKGARDATTDVLQYQYGAEVASVAADSADVVEGVAGMGVAMKYAQPSQVLLTSAKETTARLEQGDSKEGAAAAAANKEERAALESERAALERERAALAAERAKLQQQQQQQQQQAQPGGQAQQRKGGWPFGGFAPA